MQVASPAAAWAAVCAPAESFAVVVTPAVVAPPSAAVGPAVVPASVLVAFPPPPALSPPLVPVPVLGLAPPPPVSAAVVLVFVSASPLDEPSAPAATAGGARKSDPFDAGAVTVVGAAALAPVVPAPSPSLPGAAEVGGVCVCWATDAASASAVAVVVAAVLCGAVVVDFAAPGTAK